MTDQSLQVRRLPALVAVLLFCVFWVVSFAAPVSAAVTTLLDYNDYIIDVSVDGDNDVVTCIIPSSVCDPRWRLYADSDWSTVYDESLSHHANFLIPSTGIFMAEYFTFGSTVDLDVTNIPNGSTIEAEFSIDFAAYGTDSFDYCSFQVEYYDINGLKIGELWVHLSDLSSFLDGTTLIYTIPISFVVDKPDGAVSCNCNFFIRKLYAMNDDDSAEIVVYASDLKLTMAISSLYRLQQETGKNNEILEEVKKQLAEQGQTLDDVLAEQQKTNEKLDEVISGSQESQDKADQMITDSEDVQDQISDKVSDGQDAMDQLEGLDRPSISDEVIAPSWVNGSSVAMDLNKLVQLLWDNDLIHEMLVLACTVMLASYVLFGKKV